MVHYKKEGVGEGIGIPNFCLGKKSVGEYFKKRSFIMLIEAHKELIKNIANLCKLEVFEDTGIFDLNGMDNMHWYIYDQEINPVEPMRKEWIQRKKGSTVG